MPCMRASACKETFHIIYTQAIISVTMIFSLVGTLGYLAFGKGQKQAIT